MGKIIDNESEMEIMGFTVRWWGIVFALVLGTTIVLVLVNRPIQDMETRTTRHSLQYITSHQSALRALYNQYHDPALSEPQRRAIFQQLRYEADLIPGNIPPDIQNDLNQGLR